jgi:hypothetical protein
MGMMGDTPDQVAHSMAFLQMDLTDAEFRAHAVPRSRGVRALVDLAIAAGELTRCDSRRLAGALEAILTGSVLASTFHRKGTLANWLRRAPRTVIAPYVA